MFEKLDPQTLAFYRQALTTLEEGGIAFLVGGAYAFARYTGIERHTKDFDVFVRPHDARRVLDVFDRAGYRTELTHPHWLGKVFGDHAFVDVIYRSGNSVAEVDDGWFEHAVEDKIFETPVRLCPAEEIMWSKGFVMERERFDGADMAHLIRARGEQLDWSRLLRRYGPHWRVLLSHLILFGYIYPSEAARIPEWLVSELLGRVREKAAGAPTDERICQGTFLSRSQYLVDVERWGYKDARLQPRGPMSEGDVAHWTDAIEIDGSH